MRRRRSVRCCVIGSGRHECAMAGLAGASKPAWLSRSSHDPLRARQRELGDCWRVDRMSCVASRFCRTFAATHRTGAFLAGTQVLRLAIGQGKGTCHACRKWHGVVIVVPSIRESVAVEENSQLCSALSVARPTQGGASKGFACAWNLARLNRPSCDPRIFQQRDGGVRLLASGPYVATRYCGLFFFEAPHETAIVTSGRDKRRQVRPVLRRRACH